MSAGTREQIRYLVQHGLVDVLVTTAGGVEEDLIKVQGLRCRCTMRPASLSVLRAPGCQAMRAPCSAVACSSMPLQRADAPVLVTRQCLAPTYVGDFHLKGAELRREGLNRIGNMLVPNSNYCAFEDWIMPVFEAMLREQQDQGTRWTPSSVRETLGLTACRGPWAVVVNRVSGMAASRQCC